MFWKSPTLRMFCFFDLKSTNRIKMEKITPICHYNALLRIWNVIYMIFSVHLDNFFDEFVFFPRFLKTQQISLRKPTNFSKNQTVCQNHQKLTNVGFLWQFLQQIFNFDPKVSDILSVNFMFVRLFKKKNEDILNLKKTK